MSLNGEFVAVCGLWLFFLDMCVCVVYVCVWYVLVHGACMCVFCVCVFVFSIGMHFLFSVCACIFCVLGATKCVHVCKCVFVFSLCMCECTCVCVCMCVCVCIHTCMLACIFMSSVHAFVHVHSIEAVNTAAKKCVLENQTCIGQTWKLWEKHTLM